MSIDLERARADTPGCREVLHFNNAGASLMPRPVLETVTAHLELEAAIGGYEAAGQAAMHREQVYDSIATLLRCRRDEIALIENATRAWDMAFYSIPFSVGDRILTSPASYASNYIAFLQTARRTGAEIEVIPNDQNGQIDLHALENAIDDHVRLIALTHAPTNGGLVNPAAEVGEIARAAGVYYLLDACQSAGQIPLDVRRLGCDFLSATGRKFLRGPRGTGFLYVRSAVLDQLEPPMLDLHAATWVSPDRYIMRGDARRFENWEANIAGQLGLGAAVEYALGWGLEAIRARVSALAADLRARLAALPGVTVHDQGLERSGIVTFTVKHWSPDRLQQRLAAEQINISVSNRSSALLDMQARRLEKLARASVHYYNSEDEVRRFVEAVARIAV